MFASFINNFEVNGSWKKVNSGSPDYYSARYCVKNILACLV